MAFRKHDWAFGYNELFYQEFYSIYWQKYVRCIQIKIYSQWRNVSKHATNLIDILNIKLNVCKCGKKFSNIYFKVGRTF